MLYRVGLLQNDGDRALVYFTSTYSRALRCFNLKNVTLLRGSVSEDIADVQKIVLPVCHLYFKENNIYSSQGAFSFQGYEPFRTKLVYGYCSISSRKNVELERILSMTVAAYAGNTSLIASQFENSQILIENEIVPPRQIQFNLILQMMRNKNGELKKLNSHQIFDDLRVFESEKIR